MGYRGGWDSYRGLIQKRLRRGLVEKKDPPGGGSKGENYGRGGPGREIVKVWCYLCKFWGVGWRGGPIPESGGWGVAGRVSRENFTFDANFGTMNPCSTQREIEMIKQYWLFLTRYWVVVEWAGLVAHHWARSEAEALEWASCYPRGVAIIGKRKRIIAERWC